jgi:hypothetical protein
VNGFNWDDVGVAEIFVWLPILYIINIIIYNIGNPLRHSGNQFTGLCGACCRAGGGVSPN